jgi:hypothetical protein
MHTTTEVSRTIPVRVTDDGDVYIVQESGLLKGLTVAIEFTRGALKPVRFPLDDSEALATRLLRQRRTLGHARLFNCSLGTILTVVFDGMDDGLNIAFDPQDGARQQIIQEILGAPKGMEEYA